MNDEQEATVSIEKKTVPWEKIGLFDVVDNRTGG